VYGRRDGFGMVGHTLVFCALGLLIESFYFDPINKVFYEAGLQVNGLRYEHVAGFGGFSIKIK